MLSLSTINNTQTIPINNANQSPKFTIKTQSPNFNTKTQSPNFNTKHQPIQMNLVSQPVQMNVVSQPVQMNTNSVQMNVVSQPVQMNTNSVQMNVVSQPVQMNTNSVQMNVVSQPVQMNTKPLQMNVGSQTIQMNLVSQPVQMNLVSQPVQMNTKPVQMNVVSKPVQMNVVSKPIQMNVGSQPIQMNVKPVQMNTNKVQPLVLNTNVQYPTADDYKEYDHRTHVYMRPDTYIGADEKMVRDEWVYDFVTGTMVNSTIDFVAGCERLYLEVLTNASDNVGRSRRAGVDPGRIEIVMDNSTISVTNYGLPIPVQIHPEKQVYVPQMIFGSLLTGSNFEVDRHEAGTNGIGAKAANIFSTQFMVIVHDHIRQLKYTQIWNDNMTRCNEHEIEVYEGKLSSVQIIYKMDFERFKYPIPNGNQGGYPPEAFALFARHAIDISFTSKSTVSFNGTEFKFANIRDYARLYFGEAVDTAIVHYQWPPNTEVIVKKKGYQLAKNPAITPEIELIAIDTPDSGYHVSFVNCMMTRDGGVHINASVKAVGDSAVKMINDSVIKKLTKINKGKELDTKDKRSHTITINDVKPHISILLSAKLLNPKFTSQTKTTLHSPVPKINIASEDLKNINKWELIDRLYAALDAKQYASLSKKDGKSKRNVMLNKGIDANNAGKPSKHQCVLYITEGNSGAGYANKLVNLVPGGRDFVGVLPMKGKSLNVMNADRYQIEKNKEINELNEMLGLVPFTDYNDPNNFKKLRYGAIMIMADSDVDGKHIMGLIINFFHCRAPTLLTRNFVMYYRTPTLRVTHGKLVEKFYTHREYMEWTLTTPNYKKWEHKYYKGLGSSENLDVRDDYKTPRVVSCVYDSEAPNAIKLAFDKKLSDNRKEWIRNFQHSIEFEDAQLQPISWFINNELILFSIADVARSLPKLNDGFKESHRKIIYGAHKKWKIGSKKPYPEFKVGRFGFFVAEKSNYQHGELILGDVIVGLAQDFTGSNNIPWFVQKGQFGTKFSGGSDAAETRYSGTKPTRLFKYILRKEDQPILKYMTDEGDEIEPESYKPIIPMILVNGSHGIGTGFSTFVPCHNPEDLVNWLRLKLQNTPDQDLPMILPWYREFSGTIKVIDRRLRKKRAKGKVDVFIINNESVDGNIIPNVVNMEAEDENDEEDDSEEDEDQIFNGSINGNRPLLSMVTMGKFHLESGNVIVITELPIGKWPLKYHKWLEKLRFENKITDFKNLSGREDKNSMIDGNSVYFEIYGFTDTPNYRSLKLKRTMGMSNMVLLDDDNRPVRYDTSNQIMETFYERRLPIYQERKDYELAHLLEDISTMNHKISFIQAVISKEIRIINRKKATIYEGLDKLGIPHEIYDKSMNHHLSEDDIVSFKSLIAAKQLEYDTISQTTTSQMWLRDLDEFMHEYNIVYKTKKQNTDKIELSIGLNNTSVPVRHTFMVAPKSSAKSSAKSSVRSSPKTLVRSSPKSLSNVKLPMQVISQNTMLTIPSPKISVPLAKITTLHVKPINPSPTILLSVK